MTQFQFDDVDADIVAAWEFLWNLKSGPRVGDAVIMPNGEQHYFCYHWGDGIQTTKGGSFCMHWDWISYSGGLDPSIKIERIVDTGQMAENTFWMFHHNEVGAHRGVYFKMPVRLFKVVP